MFNICKRRTTMKLSQKEIKIIKKKPVESKKSTSTKYNAEELRGMYEKVLRSSKISTPKKGKGSYTRSKNKKGQLQY